MLSITPIALGLILPMVFGATVPPELSDRKDEGSVWCPAPIVGQKCPDGSIFHYYYCCGTANKDCCSSLETWFIVVLAIFGILVVSAIAVGILRFLKRRG
ncbi:unnamed protein product [Bursaphelenchus xylophilus]|uniref:(pine wood nematode) hypothetical protein n=1 Tax=Bursaphelenchus xylophilus TaxID=6326 RepID=A0A1I7RLU9_BURXY|nr:unnamed protein product [Bursaphelenchus xylophilus]CAG9106222.1 unnamed protein product [Bursaphelenchus xylophilus]